MADIIELFPESCGEEACWHTPQEHRAFDRGLRAAEAGKEEESNPYRSDELAEAWGCGYSAGSFNRKEEEA